MYRFATLYDISEELDQIINDPNNERISIFIIIIMRLIKLVLDFVTDYYFEKGL